MAADIANPQIILFLHRGHFPAPPTPPFLLDREKNDTWWADGQLASRDTTQVGSLTPVSGEFKEGGVAGVKLHNVVNFRDKKIGLEFMTPLIV